MIFGWAVILWLYRNFLLKPISDRSCALNSSHREIPYLFLCSTHFPAAKWHMALIRAWSTKHQDQLQGTPEIGSSDVSNDHILVGGFNSFDKYISQIGSSPQVRVKIKNVWNHHPETCALYIHYYSLGTAYTLVLVAKFTNYHCYRIFSHASIYFNQMTVALKSIGQVWKENGTFIQACFSFGYPSGPPLAHN